MPIGLLKRPEGMSVEEFRRWWLEVHAPKVKKWPGLKAYSVNLTLADDAPFDGVAEVWFESERQAREVFDTAEGQIARESATSNSSQIIILLAEEHVMVSAR
jgi:uncharacterized protein (TIGR02118 family)